MKKKDILGLKITGPTTYFDEKGEKKVSPSVIGFAHVVKVEQNKQMQKKENITEQDVIETGRKEIGKYLKSIREEKELTYYAVGKNSGLSIAQIQAIESGENAYTIDSFLRICRALDCYFFLRNRDENHLNQEHFEGKINE